MQRWIPTVFALALCSVAACGAGDGGSGGNGGNGSDGGAGNPDVTTSLDATAFGHPDGGSSGGNHDAGRDVGPNLDAFFANDPPPRYCGPDGSTPPDGGGLVSPGGTPECPDDKNREGCPCDLSRVGQQVPCWPGLRAQRGRGVCHDGMTTCQPYDEISGRWGACDGVVLPTPGATRGAGACMCFSAGQWQIDNTSPCFVTYSGQTYAVSTYVPRGGTAQCPQHLSAMPPPQPEPGQVWSTNSLRVDCTGQFELCYTIKAGDAMHPMAGDCTVAQTCTSAVYTTANAMQTLPPLPSWTSSDSACAGRFLASGGYGEMSVRGQSTACEQIDDGSGARYVFQRVPYCPASCNMNPTTPDCMRCQMGGSGGF